MSSVASKVWGLFAALVTAFLVFAGAALGQTATVDTNGVRMAVPTTSLMYEHTSDNEELWVAEYSDDCTVRIVTDAKAWNGKDDTVVAYAQTSVEKATGEHTDAKVSDAQWSVSDTGTRYVSAGAAWEDGMLLLACVPCNTSKVSVVAIEVTGSLDQTAKNDISELLATLDLAPVLYCDVVSLLGLDPTLIPDTLESQGLTYMAATDGEGGTWAGIVEESFYGSDLVEVTCIRLAASQDEWPMLSQADLTDGTAVSGVQIEWIGAEVPWDEPLDVLDALSDTLALTPEYETGYVTGLEEDESYCWAAIGEFKLGARDAYWTLYIEMDGQGGGSIMLSADLFDNGYGSSTETIEDVAEFLFL